MSYQRSSLLLAFFVLFVSDPLAVMGELLAQTSTSVGQPASNEFPRHRSDSFETKVELLKDAWKNEDYDLARSLTLSLRDTVVQSQNEGRIHFRTSPINLPTIQVKDLPAPQARWASGWTFAKSLSVEETVGIDRDAEPVEATFRFAADECTSLIREVRLARLMQSRLVEVPVQAFNEIHRGDERFVTLIWMANCPAKQRVNYLLFFGNPDAELPQYPSDLETQGEGVGLDISNAFYRASLSRQTGQLERLTLRREHGLELFSGGQGHGEAPGIDWAHDYVDHGHFQKLRISLWDQCPDYQVFRGPICTIVRRWGFPRSPVHPVYTPARLKIDVEYRFFTGLPWFMKLGSMTAVQAFEAAALRDDEWVFSGQSFTNTLWMNRDGKLQLGTPDKDHQDDLWGVGFYHNVSKDSFLALFLEHRAEGLPELKHSGVPQMFYRWHGHVWSRYPLPVQMVPKGAALHQKNVYLSIPFEERTTPPQIEQLRRGLMSPLTVSPGLAEMPLAKAGDSSIESTPLARPGEAGTAVEIKRAIWKALEDCKDAQLYTADINVVELGLIDDVRVRGDVVTIRMMMPHRGRTLAGYFVDGSISVHPTFSQPIRERVSRVPGIRQVVVEQVWEPAWTTNRLTNSGRKKLGLD